MENKINRMQTPTNIFSQAREQTVEADLILPDYYPEIGKILDCSVSLMQEAVSLTNDKISISGAANVKLLYLSAENEMKVFGSVTKYTKLIPGGDFETGDICLVHQNVTNLNYRAVSPRKTEVRAEVSVNADVYRMVQTTLLEELNDTRLEKRITETEGFHVHALTSEKLELNENVSLPVERDKIDGLLKESAHVTWNEIRAIHHKIMLNGVVEIGFSFITKQGEVSAPYTVTLPFTQVKDVYGTEEKDVCFLQVTDINVSMDLHNAQSGTAECKVEANVVLIVGAQQTCRLVEDVYGIRGCADKKTVQCVWTENAAQITHGLRVTGELPIYDAEINAIAAKSVSDLTFHIAAAQEQTELSGRFVLKLLAKTADGSFCAFSRSCSFSELLPVNGVISFASVGLYPKNITAEYRTDGKIGYSVELSAELLVMRGRQKELITDVIFEEDEPQENKERIILYYGAKGESIWNIGKENRTPLSALKTLNALEDDVLSENKLLIFQN